MHRDCRDHRTTSVCREHLLLSIYVLKVVCLLLLLLVNSIIISSTSSYLLLGFGRIAREHVCAFTYVNTDIGTDVADGFYYIFRIRELLTFCCAEVLRVH